MSGRTDVRLWAAVLRTTGANTGNTDLAADDRKGTIVRKSVVGVRSVRCGQTITNVQKAFLLRTVSRLYTNILAFVR